MKLDTMDTATVMRVDHKTGLFTEVNRPSITVRVIALGYGRKKFVSDAGSWSLSCASRDSKYGQDTTGEFMRCLDNTTHCAGCKPTLVVAMFVADFGPALLEVSASVAVAISDRLAPFISRGYPLESIVVQLHLGLTQSSRMTFAQCSVNLLDALHMQQAVPRPAPGAIDSLMEDFHSHVESTFTVRSPRSSRPDLGSAELVV